MEKNAKIYVAGHHGLVGSAIIRKLKSEGYSNLMTRSFQALDLRRQEKVEKFFQEEHPDYVIDAAAKVGGILANDTYRADFIYENLMIQNNLIHSAHVNGVKKLLFLGSSCIYPKHAPQPLKEEYLLTGLLEPTNEPYAIAKIAGIKMCENYYKQYGDSFISVMPTNLYGPNDNYNLENSHVLPALIRKFHLAKCIEDENWDLLKKDLQQDQIIRNPLDKEVPRLCKELEKFGIIREADQTVKIRLWGTGEVYREFLHVDDMADACIYLMNHVESGYIYDQLNVSHINIGTGKDITIKELANMVKQIVGSTAMIEWDNTKPDGTPKKQLNTSRLEKLGWKPKIALKEGMESVYRKYQKNI